MTEKQDYKKAFEFAVQQRDALRKERDEFREACRKYELWFIEARQLVTQYYVSLKALGALPEDEKLPWEDILDG